MHKQFVVIDELI